MWRRKHVGVRSVIVLIVAIFQLSLLYFANAEAAPKLVHVLVALCDNENQGIVPVPAALGNGQDPKSNLYWGAAYGVKTVFTKSPDWKLLSTILNPQPHVLERVIFRHAKTGTYLVADAYQGDRIKNAIVDFLNFSKGKFSIDVANPSGVGESKLFGGAAADLLVYIGHNGLMDFSIGPVGDASAFWQRAVALSSQQPAKAKRDAIILACYSKAYFKKLLARSQVNPLVWSTGLMAPEAYILEAALKGWVIQESAEQIRLRAARAYHRYQKCGLRAAKNLLVSGWGE